MVARITYGKNIVGVLEYNKLKVDKETAGVLCCHKLPVMPLDGKIDFHKLVEAFAPHLSDPRSRLSDPVFHASLNPHPEDRLSDARLIEIAHEYMERMGYGAQPFVVFKHEDIARSHLHIVSICIGPDGKTIDRYNDRKRSQEITRELERQYGLHSSQGERPVFEELRRVDYRAGNVRAQVASVVRSMTDRYRFASAGELNTLLRPFNVWLEECRGEARGRTYEGVLYGALDASGERIGNPIPASRIGRDVGYDALQRQYAATKSWIRENRERLEPTKEAIRQAMRQCRTPEEFAETMRRAGISVVFHRSGKNDGRIFGVTFIDHDNRLVVNGSRLDRAFSANNFERLFAQAGDETRNTEKENLPDSPKIPGRIPDRHPQRSDTAGKWLLFDLLDTLLDEAAAPDPYEEYEMIQKRRKRRVQN